MLPLVHSRSLICDVTSTPIAMRSPLENLRSGAQHSDASVAQDCSISLLSRSMTFLARDRTSRFSRWAYRIVVLMSECPNTSFTSYKLIPFWMSREAWVWRRV